MDKGVFTLSLDCEGLWGVADHLGASTQSINQNSLTEVYRYIEDVLSHHSIKATYAFTTLFTQDESDILKYKDIIKSYVNEQDKWYKYIYSTLQNESLNGWLGRELYLQAKQNGHEIAWHGFTHHPLGQTTRESIVKFEIAESLKIFEKESISVNSLVFPRNDVGHLKLLNNSGFNVYRKGLIEQSRLHSNKYYRVLDELNILKPSQKFKQSKNNPMISLPAGYFLKWPSGAKKFIPSEVTYKRWDHILRSASHKSAQAHMWFHPHNMITAPKMRDTFESIIKNVSTKIQNGELINLTMDECKRYYK
ncbi:polysaccharide deacetylase family protein [Psychrobacter pocilloporae]|uniref:polysaccharide deacetylase family protein n=1 Tax=Psychrobacter pocilloporae TaxID=1775882 RepID=UPI003C2B9CB2